MFKAIKKKLSFTFALCFFIVLLVFVVLIYFSLIQLMESQHLDELETYYLQEKHDLFEHMDEQDQEISYEPNRNFFYYIYTNEDRFVHGDETVKGLSHEVENTFHSEDVSQRVVKKIQVKEDHFLLLSVPIVSENKFEGYIILGKSITLQYHFFQKVIWLFVGLICIFTVIIGWISYFMAGKAMVPIQKSFEKQKKFVSDASHELRTPLSIFDSSLYILKTDEIDNLSVFGKELITDLRDEAALMKDLLEKLLFLARHDQNRLNIKKESMFLSEMLTNIGVKFERTLPEEIAFHLEVEKNIQLVGDEKRINELLYILLENASQYTQQGFIRLSLLSTNSAIEIIVEDTGSGISTDVFPLIFDRFYRSDTARKRDGTGLGLSIAQAIVEEHNGTIDVTSELGKGTSFNVLFPFIQK